MRKKIRILLLLFLAPLCCVLFTACDDIAALKDALPEFSSDEPNLLSGHWQVASSTVGVYAYDLTLKINGKYTFIPQDESEAVSGTYTISYDHLDLLESSGTITFSAGITPGSDAVTMDFSFKASEEKGPQTLKLKCDSFQNEFSFVGR